MKALKAVLALLLVAAGAVTEYRIVLPAIHCNEIKGRANSALRIRDRVPNSYEQIELARRMAAECARCIESFPNDAEFRTLLASNQHALGMLDEAEHNYRLALDLNERAETYAYLALLQLDQGRLDEARQNLVHACLFDISLVDLVSSPMKEEVYEAVMKRHEKLRGGSRPTS